MGWSTTPFGVAVVVVVVVVVVVGVVGAGAGVGAGVVVDDELLVGVWVEPLDVSVGAVGAGVVLAGAGVLVLPPSVVPDDEELELVGVVV